MPKIIQEREKLLKKIAKKYKIKLILMFGSEVNKKTHKMSDVDIGVLLEKSGFSFTKYSSLMENFQKIFPGREIDLAIINNADPLFLKKIFENCQLLFGKKEELAKLKLYSFHQFCDYQKYFDLEREFAKRFLSQFK